jgi:iron-sulfur cluster assembly protein
MCFAVRFVIAPWSQQGGSRLQPRHPNGRENRALAPEGWGASEEEKLDRNKNMIHVTEKAATKIQELLAKEGVAAETGGLRVGVQGGGCSGLTYAMRLETQARDRDKVIEENGARIFVDPKSFLYLNETTLDYQEDLMRRGFVFQNPQATRSCGCGTSFTQ